VGFNGHDNESPKTQESLTLSLVFGKCMRMSENGSYRQLCHFNREVIMNLFSYRTKLLCGFVSNKGMAPNINWFFRNMIQMMINTMTLRFSVVRQPHVDLSHAHTHQSMWESQRPVDIVRVDICC
jgi:hypothetical protein